MIRYFIILGILIVAAGGIVIGALLWLSQTAIPSPSTNNTQQPDVNLHSTYTITLPSDQTKEAVQSAFQKELVSTTPDTSKIPDNIKPRQTSVVDRYALQVWTGDRTGGEALLKYDDAKKQWIVVSIGGGAMSIGALMALGVPKEVAVALLADLPH